MKNKKLQVCLITCSLIYFVLLVLGEINLTTIILSIVISCLAIIDCVYSIREFYTSYKKLKEKARVTENNELNTFYTSLINEDVNEDEIVDIKNDTRIYCRDNIENGSNIIYVKTNNQQDDVIKMMLGNLTEIKEYYKMSKEQAAHAFSWAVKMCAIGIIFIFITILISLFKSESLINVIIPVIGSVITEAVGATIFFVYKKSLNQLNQYYNSLHDNERFLSIVHLTSKMSKERQDDMYCEIIRSQLSQSNNTKTDDSDKEKKD